MASFKFNTPKDSLNALLGDRNEQKSVLIDIDELEEIYEQPFKAYSSSNLKLLAEDIRINGMFSPLLIVPNEANDGKKYRILAGRNRYNACKLLGMAEIPCIIRRNLNKYQQDLILVNSNLMQRQKLLPSEKARAYKLQQEACKALGLKLESGESTANTYKYIRINSLIPPLMERLDKEELQFSTAYELSGLSAPAQSVFEKYALNGEVIDTHLVIRVRDAEKNGVEISESFVDMLKNSANALSESDPHYSVSVGNAPAAHDSNVTALKQTASTLYNGPSLPVDVDSSSGQQIVHDEDNRANRPISSVNTASKKIQKSENVEDVLLRAEEGRNKINVNLEKNDLKLYRNELPWSLRVRCDMDHLKQIILENIGYIADKYYKKYQ